MAKDLAGISPETNRPSVRAGEGWKHACIPQSGEQERDRMGEAQSHCEYLREFVPKREKQTSQGIWCNPSFCALTL